MDEVKQPKPKKFTFFSKLKIWFIGLLMGLVVGAVGLYFFQTYNPIDLPTVDQTLAVSTVFERVVAQNELVCASQKYNITEKATNTKTIPFTNIPNPLTENSYWYRYVGTLKMAADLSKATYTTRGKTITIELDQPYISSNTPDMEMSHVLEEHNNALNPITVDQLDEFKKSCIEKSETLAVEDGIVDEARTNAESNIRGMFNAAFGDEYEVEFVWRDAEETTEAAAE